MQFNNSPAAESYPIEQAVEEQDFISQEDASLPAPDPTFNADSFAAEARRLEWAALGCIMSSEEAADTLFEKLSPEHFTNYRHREIFEVCRDMALKGESVDIITLAEKLDEKNRLDSVGGLAYLGQIQSSGYAPVNAAAYANILDEQRILSSLNGLSGSIGKILNSGLSPREKLDRAESLLAGVGVNHSKGPDNAKAALAKMITKLEERVDSSGGLTGLPTGLTELDQMTSGLQKGDLIIIAGRPSMGKTTLAENIASHNSYRGKSVFTFSLEMPSEQIMDRSFSSRKRVPLKDIRAANLNDLQWSLLTEFIGEMSHEDMRFFIDDQSAVTVNDIRSRCRKIKRQFGLDLVVIDYLQLINMPEGENQSVRVGNVSRALKQMARELEVPVIVLSQLSRDVEKRQDKRPIMADLRESGAIEQDADLILFVYRDEVYHPDTEYKGLAELLLRKQRNGPTGDVVTKFEGQYCRFRERDDDHWD